MRSLKTTHAITTLALLLLGCGGAAPAPAHPPRAPGEPRASAAFRQEHRELLRRIDETERAAVALASLPAEELDAAIQRIAAFFHQDLAPHAAAEEHVLYVVADRHVPTPSPYRWTDSLRYEHTVVHAAIEEMHRFVEGGDHSAEAIAAFQSLVIRTLGLVRGHFGAEENVVLDALDRTMTPAQFQDEVIEPTEAFVHARTGATHHH